MILKIGNLLSLLLAEAWYINNPDWEPAILFVGLLVGLIAQELKSTNSNNKLSQKEKLESLYIKTHEMFEEAIKAINEYSENDLNSRFSKLTAEVQMVASNEVIEKYIIVTNLLSDWFSLYIKAYTEPINGISFLYSSNADSTLEYKKSEKEAYEKFYKEYESLIKEMQSEIRNKT